MPNQKTVSIFSKQIFSILFVGVGFFLVSEPFEAKAQRSVNEVMGATPPSHPTIRQPQEATGGMMRKSGTFETTRFPSRFVYLNGSNISSVRNQELENVTVKIDDHGNMHILAPQYEVSNDPSYHPLMTGELPVFPKAKIEIEGLPQGRYSKDPATGRANGISAPNQPTEPVVPRAAAEKDLQPMQPLKPEAKADSPSTHTSIPGVPPVPAAPASQIPTTLPQTLKN